MKNLFLIIGLSLMAINSYAQKPYENRSGFKYEIKPKHQLPEEAKFFNVEVESPIMILTNYEKDENPKTFEQVSTKMKLDTAAKYFSVFTYQLMLVPIKTITP